MAKRKATARAADETPNNTSQDTQAGTATGTIQQDAESAQAADTDFDPAKLEQQPFAEREKARRADPFDSNGYGWPDGYKIAYQESSSRRTVEIQFGDGSRADQPQNFEEIKPLLRENGMAWNGTNAWVIDLVPERGSLAQREDARRENRDIRSRIEDVVLPAIVALEEQKRGEIDLTDETRQRINKAASNHR